ncbi:MAG: Gfo/Idh/MocA family oxidoreductase [Eubacteriales bacterium]|nr:Gfo/Idh/MocA family oxidoreductase [Eubacteriales bacterium]
MIKVAIIGCGAIAHKRHAIEYFNNSNAELVGCFDQQVSRAESLVAAFGGKVYPNVEAIFTDPTIDAVSVCSANAFHAALTIQALNAGKHVLCEKPMATTYADCLAMVSAAEKNGRRILIGHNQRLTATHRKAHDILASGELGNVLSFASTFGHQGPENWSVDHSKNTWFFTKSAAAFGSMADLGIHKIDLIRYLTGSEVVSVQSTLATIDKKFENGQPIDVDDNSIHVIRLQNGAIGTVTTSWTYYGDENNSTTIYCEKGIMKLYGDPEYSLEITHKDLTRVHYEIDRISTNTDKQQVSSGVIDLFIDSLIHDQPSLIDAQEIIRSMEVVFACLESGEKHQIVYV